jgi:peptidyl-prolyl cis-trans isomerase D
MVKPFNDFVFNSSGSIGLVETLFGFHIIKVTDKQDGIRLATVALRLELQKLLQIKRLQATRK